MIEQLLRTYPIITDQVNKRELHVILRELYEVMDKRVPGDIVEFGCYEGTSSLFIQRLLNLTDPTRIFHVYDSFAGLPGKVAADYSSAGEQFKKGELHASKQTFVQNFKRAHLPLPTIHKGWFSELNPDEVPDTVAFAFLDGDFYQSINDSLALLKNKLAPGAVIVVDDYQSEALPGTARAVDEWLMRHPSKFRSEASLAIIKPQ